MNKILLATTLTFLSFTAFTSEGTSRVTPPQVSFSKEQLSTPYTRINLYSDTLKEERKLLVKLPEQYESSNHHYPILFLLDGNRHFFHSLSSTSTLIDEQRMPETIVVAITNNQGTRTRDLAQQNEQFLTFIEKEVIPLIESKYRTTNIRSLFGHSLAGYFTVNTWLTKPELFEHYIAASPVLQVNDKIVFSRYKAMLENGRTSNNSLYLSLAAKPAEGARASEAFDEFTNLLNKQAINGLRSLSETMPKQVHMTTPNLTLYQGLTHAFEDFAMPTITHQDILSGDWKLAELKRYYAQRANKYQVSAEIPERAYRNLGFALQDSNHSDRAIAVLKESVSYHPQSPQAFNALAQVYEESSQNELALMTYQKALTLNSVMVSKRNFQFFSEQVKRLTTELDGH